MKLFLICGFVLISSFVFSQSTIEWEPDYHLTFEDFQSPETEINPSYNSYSIISGATMDFSFQMSSYEFMFTKNFNSKARTIFNRYSAVISAPDSIFADQLVSLGQYSFDLTELYTRKFRQELYSKKGTFSDANFFQSIYKELQQEMNIEYSRVMKLSDFGRNTEILKEKHQQVLVEIELLHEFCKDCKPIKKKK